MGIVGVTVLVSGCGYRSIIFCGKWAWRVIMRGLAWGSSAGMGMLGGVVGSVVYG